MIKKKHSKPRPVQTALQVFTRKRCWTLKGQITQMRNLARALADNELLTKAEDLKLHWIAEDLDGLLKEFSNGTRQLKQKLGLRRKQ